MCVMVKDSNSDDKHAKIPAPKKKVTIGRSIAEIIGEVEKYISVTEDCGIEVQGESNPN